MAEYGPKIDEYLTKQGENVQKLTLSIEDLRDNDLVDKDGEISLVPKAKREVLSVDIASPPLTFPMHRFPKTAT